MWDQEDGETRAESVAELHGPEESRSKRTVFQPLGAINLFDKRY
jgi:hypothetical protein